MLKTSFIVFLLSPHHRNFNKRLIKSPKLYFYDTGVLCHLLGIRDATQLYAHPLRGAIFENFIVAEVAKAYQHHRRVPPLFFWRDRSGHEIDLVIEEAGALYPVEVKSSQTFDADMLEGLVRWTEISGSAQADATLVFGGQDFLEHKEIGIRPWYAV